jgi:hypothetical protein
VGPAVGQLVEAFVVLHVQGHVAHLTLEARLVPDLFETFDFLDWINALFALGTLFGTHFRSFVGLFELLELFSVF